MKYYGLTIVFLLYLIPLIGLWVYERDFIWIFGLPILNLFVFVFYVIAVKDYLHKREEHHDWEKEVNSYV